MSSRSLGGRRGTAHRMSPEAPPTEAWFRLTTTTPGLGAGLGGTQFGLFSGRDRGPEGAWPPAADTTTISGLSVFPKKDTPEPPGGACVGHTLPVVLPGQGAGPPEVAGRGLKLVVSAADRKGEGGSPAAPLGVRCSLCKAGSRDYGLRSGRVRSACFQSSPCRGAPSRFPSGILTRWVPSVERGRAMNLDNPSADFAPLGFLWGEPQSSSLAQAPLSWSPFWLQDFGKVRLQPAPC